MEEEDSKRRKDVALQSVEEAMVTKGSSDQSSKDNLASFVKKFRRALKNKERDVKKAREFSKDFMFQPQGNFTFGKKQGKIISCMDKPSISEHGPCFS